MKKMSHKTGNKVLIVAFVVFACITLLFAWGGFGKDDPKAPAQTAQICADRYKALPSYDKAKWESSEEFINQCVT